MAKKTSKSKKQGSNSSPKKKSSFSKNINKAKEFIQENAEVLGDAANISQLQAASENDRKRDDVYLKLEEKNRQKTQDLYSKINYKDARLVKAALIPRSGEQSAIIRFMFNPTDLQFSRSVSIQMMEGARTRRGLPKVNFGFVEPYQLNLAGLVYDTYEQGKSVLGEIKPLLDAVNFTSFQDPYKPGSNGYQERLIKPGAGNTLLQEGGNRFANYLGKKAGVKGNINTQGFAEYGAEKALSEQALEIRRPPVYYFVWGQNNYLMCMIESLNYKLTMFLPDGTPVRALVDLTLKEVDLGVSDRALSQRQTLIKAEKG